jgi:hypothetical protein
MSKSTTAIVPAKLSIKERMHYAFGGAPTIKVGSPTDGGPDAVVSDRSVVLYRPPTTLDMSGAAQAGITKELFAHYLVAMVESAIGRRLGSADVTFGNSVGRFAEVNMTLPEWGTTIAYVIPIGLISMPLKESMDAYASGIALKFALAHRGIQDHTQANNLLFQAERGIETLRNADQPHFTTDAEFMFLMAHMRSAHSPIPVGPAQAGDSILVRPKG